MKYLIVNGDDFGASRGINRGILEAHLHGILTSASLLVNTPWSEEAAELSRIAPDLSVGLHADVGKELGASDAGPSPGLRVALREQIARFQELMGCPPTHIDSHHNTHRDPRALPAFLELAHDHGLPLREHSPVRYFSKFYGRWNGETHLEQISDSNLEEMLASEIQEGITELSCHPGYVDPDCPSGYSVEREAELRALCASRVRRVLHDVSIQLLNFRDAGKRLERAPA